MCVWLNCMYMYEYQLTQSADTCVTVHSESIGESLQVVET